MAEAVFNELSGERGLPFRAGSAGISARKGAGIAPFARDALGELGIAAVVGHESQRISHGMLDDADLVLVMGSRHEKEVERVLGDSGRVRLLAEFAGGNLGEEIPDPYGMTMFAYRASARQIYEYVERVVDRLEKEASS